MFIGYVGEEITPSISVYWHIQIAHNQISEAKDQSSAMRGSISCFRHVKTRLPRGERSCEEWKVVRRRLANPTTGIAADG